MLANTYCKSFLSRGAYKKHPISNHYLGEESYMLFNRTMTFFGMLRSFRYDVNCMLGVLGYSFRFFVKHNQDTFSLSISRQ